MRSLGAAKARKPTKKKAVLRTAPEFREETPNVGMDHVGTNQPDLPGLVC